MRFKPYTQLKAPIKVGLILVAVHFLCFQSVLAEEEQKDLKRFFTFSSGYFERAYNSNEGLSDFPLSMIQLYSKGFDVLTGTPETVAGRILTAALELPFSYWFAHSLFVPFHEFGHARASFSGGSGYSYRTSAFGNTVSGIYSYWGLSLYRLFTPPFGFPGAGNASAHYNSGSTSIDEVVLSGGGLNNQMFLAKRVADLVYLNEGHMTYFQHYIGNKISSFIYSKMDSAHGVSENSDIKAILTRYQKQQYPISHSTIETHSLVSLFSGTTVSFLMGYADYFSKGDPTVRSLEIAGFRVPDINSYINTKGLSYEFVTGYRVNQDFIFDWAYETITVGKAQRQFNLKAHYQLASIFPSLNDFWMVSDMVVGGGVGGSLELMWTPDKPSPKDSFRNLYSYFLKYINYNRYTLYGERNIPFSKNQTTSHELLAGLHYSY